jgi:hypothetical protein
MLSSMPEKVVIYALQCALCSLLFFALNSAAPVTSKTVMWLEHTRMRGHKKDTAALKLQFMLTAMQFLFFNKLSWHKKKSSTQQPEDQLCRIMKNYKLTGIPTTRVHKYPTRSCSVSQKNTTQEKRSEDSILLVCIYNSLKCREPPIQQHRI